MPHDAARELDLVTQTPFAHAARRLPKVTRRVRALPGQVARHPLDVFLELLNLTGHLVLPLIEPLLAFSPRATCVREVLHVACDIALLVRQFLGAARRVLDAPALSRLAGLLQQAAGVLDLVEGGSRR